ncbi:MAG: hypothetical protein QG597_1607, partial [Actinomycetota bacterium]|nr:hypothetical protein [Actinomycetota bacterium]
VARTAQGRQLEGLAAFGTRIETLKAACRAARAAGKPPAEVDALRRQAVRAALLLAEARSLAEAGRVEDAHAVEQVLRSLLSAKPWTESSGNP